MSRITSKTIQSDTLERVSLAGCILAAAPSVKDPLFANAVCLIVEHSDESTVGIMLNRPMAIDPKSVFGALLGSRESQGVDFAQLPSFHFNFGGPQNGPIVALHNDSTLAEGGNDHGVYMSAQADTLKKLASLTPEYLRWFIGHATWSKSQLEQEIVAGEWHVMPAIPQLVFADENMMWTHAMEWIGRSVIATFPGVTHFPITPLAN
ncbi:MAG: YqgE/AlgH family protein [Planctomycetes bacterium]|nr:YqgE/AlgH family protein [Planctomycetota bacterium]